MPAQCWECHEYGHVASDCPTKLYASEVGDGKPVWCRHCDRETRLVYTGTTETVNGRQVRHLTAHRCQDCHPQGHMLPVTYKKCRGCGRAIYAWDVRSECGKHQPIGKQLIPAARKGESEMSNGQMGDE